MDDRIAAPRRGVALVAGMLTVALAFAVHAAIGNQGGPAPVAERALGAGVITDGDAMDPALPGQSSRPMRAPRVAGQGRARCAGCAIVESVRRVDRREEVGAVCGIADYDRFAYINGTSGSDDVVGAGSLAASLAGMPGAQRTRIVSSYRITVRFRDGSRHVFNEVTGRTLQSGERIQVIAGASGVLP